VIDFGCGEAALTSVLISESIGEYPVTRLVGVDVNEDRLVLAANECQPQEFELGQNVRVNPLTIELYQGSVSEADRRLMGYDALACLEVVEHLDPDVLEKFWSVVLGTLKPRVVIVSTPNAEFNIHFTQLKYGTSDAVFRNDDHRFEWTRQEFEHWCQTAATDYGYSVSFTGVGVLSKFDPAVGFCTQFAILEDLNPLQAPRSKPSECYALISRVEYPIYTIVHTEEENREFLQEKIARIRPQPPRLAVEDDFYDFQRYMAPKNEEIKQDEGKGVVPEPDIELGVLALDDIWLDLRVRQRLKTKAWMIQMLDQMPLVEVDLENDRITFDEDDPFWKDSDECYDRQFMRDIDQVQDGLSNNDDDRFNDTIEYYPDYGMEDEQERGGYEENDGTWDSGYAYQESDERVEKRWEETERAGHDPDEEYSPWNSPVHEPPSPWSTADDHP
ncbi:Small RNA 2'-O-methyltransferase, partial [Mortierella sp. GBA30]